MNQTVTGDEASVAHAFEDLHVEGSGSRCTVCTASGLEPLAVGANGGYLPEANARLIAAAPELLIAAKRLVRALNSEIPGSPGSPFEQLREAIAKAEGSK